MSAAPPRRRGALQGVSDCHESDVSKPPMCAPVQKCIRSAGLMDSSDVIFEEPGTQGRRCGIEPAELSGSVF